MAATLRLAVVCLLGSASILDAAWTAVASLPERSAAGLVEHVRVAVKDPATGQNAELHLAVFSTKSSTLRVIDQPNEPRADLAEVMVREHCSAGVNGGYFDPEDVPVGLLISEGKSIAPLRKARLLSGVAIVANGRLQLLHFAEYSARRNASNAVQCGPFLVDHAQPVAGLDDTRPARRTFIVLAGVDRAAIGFCSEVTLAELAKILATPGLIPDLKIQRALNLDGGSSSAFWFAGQRGPFSISELKTVRNFVAVVPK